MHTNVSTHSAQRSQIPLELGLQTVVRCLMRVLEVNSVPWEKWYVLFTTEQSLWLHHRLISEHFLPPKIKGWGVQLSDRAFVWYS